MPDKEELVTYVNGQNVTSKVPVRSLQINDERGNRVGSVNMVIEDGVDLGLGELQSVTIFSLDLSIVHFNGIITDLSSVKHGVKVDYSVTCSSNEIRLQKAIVTGSFIGTEDVILAALLAAAYPPAIADLFDFASGVTPGTVPLELNLSESTLLDALQELSELAGGAAYNFSNDNDTRINIIKNPALTNDMTYYTGEIQPGSAETFIPSVWVIWGGFWNPANATWDSGFGETGGGIQLVSTQGDSVSGTRWSAILAIGASSAAGATSLHIEQGTDSWMAFSFRARITSGGAAVFVQAELVIENQEGDLLADLFDASAIPTLTGSFQTITRSFNLENAPPGTARATAYLLFQDNGSGAFTVEVDSVLCEILSGDAKQTAGAYFDGDSSDASWLGEADNSASQQGKAALEWGTNRAAPFDADFDDSALTLSNFNIDFNGFNTINSIIVSSKEWIGVDWVYPGNGDETNFHFDLEFSIHPPDTLSQPIIYKNIGSDAAPNWETQTVATPQEGFAAGNTLYDLENHWLEFQDAPPALNKSWRVVGRYQRRIRQIVTDDDNIAETGVELTDTLILENATAASAFDLGQAELTARQAQTTVEFDSYDPGLLAGDLLTVIDTSQDFNEALIIERISRRYIGGGFGIFHIECGKFIAQLDDIIYDINRDAEPTVPIGSDVESVTVSSVIDEDGSPVIDKDGATVIDVG